MPKKKRKTVDRPDSEGQDQREEEAGKFPDGSSSKHSFVDACIVISDSDGEQESKEECSLQKKRTKQQLDRAKFAAKRKITQMTEEEQFALALKMSEQEARQLNSQEEEEEELLRKAIAESLSSCQLSESSSAAALPPLSKAPGPSTQSHAAGQDDLELLPAQLPCSKSPCSKCSSRSPGESADENGQTDVAKRPFVVLTRLSKEIVESSLASSIIVSPGKSQPFARSNENSCSPTGSSSSDTPLSLGEDLPVTLSPTFPSKPLGIRPWVPQRTCSPSIPIGKPFQNHSKRDPLAGCPEAPVKVSWDHSISVLSSNPDSKLGSEVEQKKKETCLAKEPVGKTDMPQKAASPGTRLVAEKECPEQEERERVHYYWGIPFCPKGVDPNKYTQVIMCQLEVYQKSLKQAQRQLLRKKPFGDPVVLRSYSLRRGEPGKEEEALERSEGADEQEGEDMPEKEEPENVAWLLAPRNGEPDKNLEEDMAERRHPECHDEPTSSSCQASQVLFAEDVLEKREPMKIAQSISALTPLDNKRSPDISTENRVEEEITVCPETQPSPLQAIEPESREIHSSSKDVSLQDDAGEDAAKNTSAPSSSAADSMACPLCDRKFPVSEIEWHAMYCNGTGEDTTEDAPVLTRHQREAKCKPTWTSETSDSLEKCEKCYLCKSVVPRKEYPRHVSSCLKSRNNAHGAQGGRRLQHAKEEGRKEGGLLRMLEQSESKDADAEAAVTTSEGGEEDLRRKSAETDKAMGCSHDA